MQVTDAHRHITSRHIDAEMVNDMQHIANSEDYIGHSTKQTRTRIVTIL